MLLAIAVVDLLAVASGLAEYSLLTRAESPAGITDAEASANDLRQAVVGGVQFALYVTAVVLFILWFSRAYRNLPALGAEGLRFRFGWAIGGWFDPILGAALPKQIANDIWRASDPERPPDQGEDWKAAPVPRLYGVWWAAFILENWLGNIALRLSRGGDDVGELKRATAFYIFSDAIGIAGALLAARVVRRTTARQESRATRIAAAGAAAPALAPERP